jgi:hypothetical protein
VRVSWKAPRHFNYGPRFEFLDAPEPFAFNGQTNYIDSNILILSQSSGVFMEKAIYFGALVVMFLTVTYLSGKKKNGFVRHFSRGAFMRDLNKKMEEK